MSPTFGIISRKALEYHPWDGISLDTRVPELVLVLQVKRPRLYELAIRLGLAKLPYVPDNIDGVKTRIEIRGIARLL